MDKQQTEAKSAMQQAIHKALMRHRRLGKSIVIMRDGEIVTLMGDQISVPELDNPDCSLNNN
jgi:hypothetical protein